MNQKTKSIVIGMASGCAAVLIIILLFFSINGVAGNGDSKSKKGSNNNNVETVSVDSEGNIIVIVDDEDEDEDEQKDDKKTSSESAQSKESSQSEEEETVETGIFGRSDIEEITKGVKTFAQFVKAVSPVKYEWNTDKIKATSEVEVTLIAYDGSYAVIGVPYQAPDYTIDGEIEGAGEDVTQWDIYDKCKKTECRAKEIVWYSNKMKFTFPRGIKIGTDYPDVSAAYYKTPKPEKTYILYDVKDVLKNSAKMKAYNKAKEAYIGGKLYKTTTMIEYNYKDNPDAYPFVNNSKNIIRYGFNSIVDTDDALSQWYIDYATANSKVVGVYYHMKGADD